MNFQASAAGFEQQTVAILGRLQTALRALLNATPGMTRRPTELANTLGIYGKLAWEAHRFANAADPLAEASNVPGPSAMTRFLDAAARRGSPPERIAAVLEAQRELDALIKLHAGSRGQFETMVSALTKNGSDQLDLVNKRAAFKAQSHILGVQARTHLACFIYRPFESSPGRADCIAMRGLIDLRRFRKDAAWIVSQTRAVSVDGVARQELVGEPLDPQIDPQAGPSLLTRFCSQPLPGIRRVPADLPGMTNIEIVGNGIGATAAVTCLVGDLFRAAVPLRRNPANRRLISNVRVRTPCETLVQDVLLHRDMANLGTPSLDVYSDHRDLDVRLETQLEARACDRLAIRETVTYLGRGPGVMTTPDVENYAGMIDFAMTRAGWDASQFDVYRCRIEYPVMPSSVIVHFELPE